MFDVNGDEFRDPDYEWHKFEPLSGGVYWERGRRKVERKVNKETLRRILDFDPLDAVRKATGGDYRDHPELSMVMGLVDVQDRQRALKEFGDSHYGMTYSEYCVLAADLGFYMIFEEETMTDRGVAYYYAMAHDAGVLLVGDTFAWPEEKKITVNSANIWFQWKGNEKSFPRKGSGGCVERGPDDYVFSGHIDVRDALKLTMIELTEGGKFVKPWLPDGTRLWLVPYWETPSTMNEPRPDYKAITARIVGQFPEEVLAWVVCDE